MAALPFPEKCATKIHNILIFTRQLKANTKTNYLKTGIISAANNAVVLLFI